MDEANEDISNSLDVLSTHLKRLMGFLRDLRVPKYTAVFNGRIGETKDSR